MTFSQFYQLILHSPLLLGLFVCGLLLLAGVALLMLKGHQGKIRDAELKYRLSLIVEEAGTIKKGLEQATDQSAGFHFEELAIPKKAADIPDVIVIAEQKPSEESNLHVPKDIAALCRELEKNLLKKS